MNVLRCQVRLSRVVQIDIPEETLGNQLPEVLAKQTARSQYGYDNDAEVLGIERSYVENHVDDDMFCSEHQRDKHLVDYDDGSRYECPECQRERGEELGLI